MQTVLVRGRRARLCNGRPREHSPFPWTCRAAPDTAGPFHFPLKECFGGRKG